ncbi:protease B inhibitor, putative [Candida dubliniensis CD36]|uniref:Protease B inhibitor, putative n=1 Tax=Candida dubliniensis (strain CD36 / ATCC MYA-646 / CBS 7987 / NCPF 3949 / NRRL Y-17841) TaxID=573826 RepID=B9WFT4_CANDC|nr:protease B inhibitor, putative [Candida dubliniensis CD36]CAX42103.1 protease B inhibitor, putative [Candida dubliniensis CD36]
MNQNKKLTGLILLAIISIITLFNFRAISKATAIRSFVSPPSTSSSSTANINTKSAMSDSKGYIITLKDTCPDSEASSIKSKITELGGKITNEFSLIKGFSAQLPTIHAEALPKDFAGIANIEEDGEVRTQ